ncbi:HER110Cp [Eremothecium sinecaudum]|uniref:Coatomer subunit beta' n=1 Tax=Eremothecium sinecaudum TaxID=45286 RepID=A0A0X8HTW0_9SACH|nr:HER110Cp [Eremothecium sinecaudum]AMD21389.1 HER110Cp [Eremothecium sinecaudum]
MKLDTKKAFVKRTDRVKGIDFHPTEPWVLITVYSGRAEIWNYETHSEVRSITVCEAPIRAGRFIPRKNWIVVGSDDFKIRVFNYNTGEKLVDFEGHPDYIRSLAVHPTMPYVLSASDDLTVKLWNWEKNWALEQTFEGHEHFVMCVAFNPKDPNTFATACLDHTVKIWSLSQETPNFTLKAHAEKGVNFVDYYPFQDKPYLITSSDDKTAKVWDYQTKSCVATLEGHISNVSYAVYHPTLPIIISGSEDGTIKLWNSNTYKLERTLSLGLERSWCINTHPTGKRNFIASGFDNGFSILSIGSDEPKISLDPVGKLVWCGGKNSSATDVATAVIKDSEDIADGAILPLQTRELGVVDVFPQYIRHSPNGRFVTVIGDGEFIVYTALAWRNKAFGRCHDFVWGTDSNSYAYISESGEVKLCKNFKEVAGWSIPLQFGAEKLFSGNLLGVSADGALYFFDWETGALVRKVNVDARDVVWSDNGELLMILPSGSSDFSNPFVLDYCSAVYEEAVANGTLDPEEGAESAFEVLHDVKEAITSGKWVGDVFLYTTTTNRLNYFVGGKSYNLAHFDKEMYLLGYLVRDNRVYLTDREINVYGYKISIEVLEFQTLVLRGEVESARESVLPNIQGKDNLLKVSRFLEGQNMLEFALEVSPDQEQRFDLALKLGSLTLARDIIADSTNEHKWRTLGDAALKQFNFKMAIEFYRNANDLESLFLLHSSFSNKKELIAIAEEAKKAGKYNLAFNAYWVAGNIEGSTDLLVESKRFSEAAILASTYGSKQDEVADIVEKWKESLHLEGKKVIAERIEVLDKNASPLQRDSLIDIDDSEKLPKGEKTTKDTAKDVQQE